jgi:hypothetical protein
MRATRQAVFNMMARRRQNTTKSQVLQAGNKEPGPLLSATRVPSFSQAFCRYGLKTMDAKVPANSLVPIP